VRIALAWDDLVERAKLPDIGAFGIARHPRGHAARKTVALILSVVCEILAGLDGLDQWVLLSARAFRSADLLAGVIMLGATGYLMSVAVSIAPLQTSLI
jgi:hypothetical protein